MKKYVAEFIGTFFLVLAVICAINNPALSPHAPLAIGAMLIGMIYSVGKISDAHFNPVVTISFFALGKCAAKDVLPYILAQIIAACMATWLAMYVYETKAHHVAENMDVVRGGVAEILGTFALVWVIIMVAIAPENKGNGFYGLAIGMVVIGGAYVLGNQGSMGCFNPAVGLATFLDGWNTVHNLGVIVATNLIGAGIAVGVYKLFLEGR